MHCVTVIVVAVLQLAAVTSGDCPGTSISPRMLGSDAPAHEPTPWHVVIYMMKLDSWVALCGGTLVSPSHVVTAASCFWSQGNDTSINTALYEVAVGKNCEDHETIEQDMQLLKIKTVTLHPWFSATSSSLQHDVAILELKTAATITPFIGPALIERKPTVGGEDLPAGSMGTMATWETSDDRSLSSVQLPYLNFRACADLVHTQHRPVPSTDKFCAGAKDVMRTLCRQDFGAGFIYREPNSNNSFLRGVLSSELRPALFTETCHQNDVSGFTNMVDPLTLNWVTQIIPGPDVPCPAVEISVAVTNVYCHRGEDEVDCSLPMQRGTVSVSTCTPGYVAGTRRSKSATCSSDGTWTNANVTCQQADPCQPSPCGLNSQCIQVGGRAQCTCLPTFLGSPPGCRSHCIASSECPENRGCVQNKCSDLCTGACVQHASCTDINRIPLCSCLPGYTGDARTSCSLIPVRLGYDLLPGLSNRYKFHAAATLWPNAKSACESEGSHLVILNSEAEYRAIRHLLRQNKNYISGSTNRDSAWLGVKESNTRQNEFFTVLGAPLTSTGYSRWYSTQPNDQSLGDFVYIYHDLEGLHDNPPSDRNSFAFVCEIEDR